MVTPLFFPGGDIGMLAVNGTVNDLAMAGARPLYLSAAFILEEGFPLADLGRIVESMSAAAKTAGVLLVTGDTKVVDRGKADGCFITTSGRRHRRARRGDHGRAARARGPRDPERAHRRARHDDHGRRGPSSSSRRRSRATRRRSTSWCATCSTRAAKIHCLRDPTRGGVATALNEIARQSGVGMVLDEGAILVREPVRGICELLGFDPLYVANEGKLLAIVASRRMPIGCWPPCARRAEGRDARDHRRGRG